MSREWDPLKISYSSVPPFCAGRIRNDLKNITTSPPPGVFALPKDDNMCRVDLIIIGPTETPYQGGIFHFLVGFPAQYPMEPPKVKLLTTGNKTVRFNPNLYADGKVCLSILGTWAGPSWSPVLNLSALAISIQSLMNDKPYCNEPGHEQLVGEHDKKRAREYSQFVQHETIRIAVIDAMEKRDILPQLFIDKMEENYKENYEYFMEVCRTNLNLDGQKMMNVYGMSSSRFCYKKLLEKLESMKP